MTNNWPSKDWLALKEFVRESNKIEGLDRSPMTYEMQAHQDLLSVEKLIVQDLEIFALTVARGKLRNRKGMNLRIGHTMAPKGGMTVTESLTDLLKKINNREIIAFKAHCEFRKLLPFTEGNELTARALWLWVMGGAEEVPIGFLRTFHDQMMELL